MPIVHRPVVEKRHGCTLPSVGKSLKYDVGTIWECPKCGAHWEYIGDWNGLWERYAPKSRQLGPRPKVPAFFYALHTIRGDWFVDGDFGKHWCPLPEQERTDTREEQHG